VRRLALAFAVFAFFAVSCATTRTAATAAPPAETLNEHGVASWYGQEFAGRTTANGEIFDPMLMTAAHRTLPFGTIVDVRNPKTNQSVRVRINDRGPYIGNRTIDLSYAAAQQISLIDPGSGEVDVIVVKVGRGDREPPAPFSVTIGEQAAPTQVAAAPSVTASTPPVAPSTTAPMPAVVDNVAVIEEHRGVETRRQVSPSGTSVETVPVTPQPAVIAPASSAPIRPPAPVPAPARPAPAPPSAPARLTPPPARTPANTNTETVAGGRFVVQVGAFSVEANAKELQGRLTRIGQQSYIDHTSLYHVRIGPFAAREAAVQVRAKLEAAGISAIVIRP
jgi:rare lipoprotein A